MQIMIEQINASGFAVACMDGAEGMLALPDKSIKLVYGSPPYPNAERDYGIWKSSEYIDKMRPFKGTEFCNCEAACEVVKDVGIACIHYEEYCEDEK